jgi:hypothetical protein
VFVPLMFVRVMCVVVGVQVRANVCGKFVGVVELWVDVLLVSTSIHSEP